MAFRTPALMYHQTLEEGEPLTSKWMVSMVQFKAEMEKLRELGFSSIDLTSANPFSTKNGCLITFDDGHVSNLKAAELLCQYGFVGVFYVVKQKSLTDPHYLGETQIRRISEMGHTIGIHGREHVSWTNMCDAKVVTELREVNKWIADITGRPAITCSAPNGRVTQRLAGLIRENMPSIKYVRNSFYGSNIAEECEAGALVNAVAIERDTSIEEFVKIVNLHKSWYVKKQCAYVIKGIVKDLIGKD